MVQRPEEAAGNPQFEFSQGLRDELNKISALVDVVVMLSES